MASNSRVMEFDWENMPSPGLTVVAPHIVKAVMRAYYEHTKANLPITEFKYTYVLTDADLGI